MKPCPVCGGVPEEMVNLKYIRCVNAACVFHGHTIDPAAWAALPRVAPNAEQLVSTLISVAFMADAHLGNRDPDVQEARAALLRACVVDAAEVAALRVQRDEAVALAQKATAEFGALAVEHAKQANGQRDTREVDVVNHVHARGERYDGVYLSGEPGCPPGPRYFALCRIGSSKSGGGFFYAPGAPVSTPHVPFKAGRITADVDKDNVTCPDCLARLRATGVPEAELLAPQKPCCPDAGHPTDCCKAPAPPITVDVLLGVLRAPYQPNPHAVLWDESDLRRAFERLTAAPPVAEDAEVATLLDVFEDCIREEEMSATRKRLMAQRLETEPARAAVLARMRPTITAEAIHAAMADTWNVPLRSFGWGTLNHMRAVVSALQGGGK